MLRRRRFYRFHFILGLALVDARGTAWQFFPFEFLGAIHQLHPSVAQLAHHHLAARQAQRLVLAVQLIPLTLTAHCPVSLHDSFAPPN
jgi:hypothetical protein